MGVIYDIVVMGVIYVIDVIGVIDVMASSVMALWTLWRYRRCGVMDVMAL
jgi:hypothetical protein